MSRFKKFGFQHQKVENDFIFIFKANNLFYFRKQYMFHVFFCVRVHKHV